MSTAVEALVALASVVSAALGAKKDHDAAKKDELKKAIDGAAQIQPPPKVGK